MVKIDFTNKLLVVNLDGRHEVWLNQEETYNLISELVLSAEMAFSTRRYKLVDKNEIEKLFGESHD